MVAENQPGHIDQIKQTNAGAVYRLIDQLGPVSRIDLSRLAQLAPASITKITMLNQFIRFSPFVSFPDFSVSYPTIRNRASYLNTILFPYFKRYA